MATTLLEQGKTVNEIQAATGLSKGVIASCRKGKYDLPSDQIDSMRRVESDRLTIMFHDVLDHITDEKLDDATLVQTATAAGILFDKRQLVENRPTVVYEASLTDQELDKQLTDLDSRIAELQQKTGIEMEVEYSEVTVVKES